MLTVAHVLVGLAAFAAWVLFVLVRPHRRCTWCKGTRRSQRHRWWGKTGACRKCKARGRHKRIGAVTVHRFVWSVAGDRLMQRRAQRPARSNEER
jgi:hypothetical protein